MIPTKPVTGMLLGTPIDLPGGEAEPAQNCTGRDPDDDARELSLFFGARSPQNSGGGGFIFRDAGRAIPSCTKNPSLGCDRGCPAERVEGPVPPRVLRGPFSRQLPPTPSTVARADPELLPPPNPHPGQLGRERAGRELCGVEKTFVSRAHTPPLGENASAPRLSGPNRGIWREPLPRKGRDGEPTSGAGEDSRPRLGQGLSAAPGWAPPQPPPQRRPRPSRVRGNLLPLCAPAWVPLGRGAP